MKIKIKSDKIKWNWLEQLKSRLFRMAFKHPTWHHVYNIKKEKKKKKKEKKRKWTSNIVFIY